jgi:PhoPQ-activated pathogenicity-related protein
MASVFLGGSSAHAGLDDYVRHDDGAFAWRVIESKTSPAGVAHYLELTSQVWEGIKWVHQLQIYEPAELKHGDAMLLFITGGSVDRKPGPDDAATGFALARACGARCALLPQVPNQPLLDGKTEDTLIAETFVRYLDTKDENWPLLFPMAKSAVRAMDAVQAWAKRDGRFTVNRFVVSGASKRGWTTWLTAAVDKRVIAIAPMVIDTLNMKAQRAHSLEVWGKFSEQIDDYTSRGLTEKFEDRDGERLWKMVDPYSYRDRLTLPKLLINGTNDRYWTLDALNIYWDDLKGDKHVVYLPNAGHNLAVHRDYAINGVGALFRYSVMHQKLPQITWRHSDSDDGGLRLAVTSPTPTRSARLWVARSATRDFRETNWESSPMVVSGDVIVGTVKRPAEGYIGLLGDLEYEIDGIPFHLSTQIRQTGAKAAK